MESPAAETAESENEMCEIKFPERELFETGFLNAVRCGAVRCEAVRCEAERTGHRLFKSVRRNLAEMCRHLTPFSNK